MNFKFTRLPTAALRRLDASLRITTAQGVENLSRSLQQDGLLNLPVLQEWTGGWRMISGFRRLAAVQQLGWEHLPVRLLSPDSAYTACVCCAIADNALQRPLNLIEVSRALNLLETAYPDSQMQMTLAANYGLPATPALMARVKPLMHLPNELQQAILDDRLALSMALELAGLPSSEALLLLKLFIDLQLGLNRQKEFLGLMRDIARREKISLTQVLSTDTLVRICEDPGLERPRKAEQARRYLKQRRYPQLSAAETRFKTHLSALQWGPQIQLQAPPGFESPRYRISLNFESLSELAAQLDTVQSDLQHPSLTAIMER